jgi:hypothetical protein
VYAPSSELVPLAPSSGSECVSPLGSKGGEQHSLAVEGVGDPIRTTVQKAWHSVYSLASVVELKEKSPSRGRPELGRIFYFWNTKKKAAKL